MSARPPEWWESGPLWLGLALVSALPFFVSPLPLMPDLFSHIGRYYVMLHAGEPDIARYYEFHWAIRTNIGVDLIVWALSYLLPVETAAWCAVVIIPPLTVAGIYALARATGDISPGAMIALNMVWSFTFFYGFVNFSLGVGLALLSAALWISLSDRRWLRLGAGIATGVVVWLCHLAAFGILLVILGSYQLVGRPGAGSGFRDRMKRVAELVPLLLPVVLGIMFASPDNQNAPLFANFVYEQKIHFALQILRENYKHINQIEAAAMFFVMAFIGVRALRGRSTADWRLLLAGSILCGLFLVLPTGVIGSYYADLRLLPAAVILILLAGKGFGRRTGQVLATAGLALFIVRIGLTSADWYNRSQSTTAELAALQHVPHGSRIAAFACIKGCGNDWRLAGYDHLSSLAIPRRRAFVNSEWDVSGNGLTPVYNSGLGYNDVESVAVVPPELVGPGGEVTVEQRLATLPRDRFDFVWVFNRPFNENAYPWLVPLHRGPVGVLFAIRH